MLALALLGAPALAGNAPGATIPNAVAIDVSDDGLDAFLPIATTLLPSQIDVPTFADADEGGCVWGLCAYSYEYSITNGWASVTINDADITPGNGVLYLDANLTVQVNQQSDPVDIYLHGTGIEIISITETCDAWVDPFDIQIQGEIGLTMNPDGTANVSFPPLDWQWTLTGDDFQLANCGTVTAIEDFLDFFGVDVFGLVLDFVEPEIASAIDGLSQDLDLQTAVNDALASATISEEIDLGGVILSVDVAPSAIDIVPQGVRIALDGSISAPADPCVEPYGITESLATASTLPGVGAFASGLPFTPQVGVYVDDDLVNEGLFAVWNAGLLCQTIDDSTGDLPLAIDTNLLGLLAPGVYDDLFPESRPIGIITRPTQPPIGSTTGPHDLNIDVHELGLDFYADFEGRQARLMRVDLEVAAGLDIDFDGATGGLAIDVALGGDAVTAAVTYNELTPEANEQVADQLVGLVDQLVGPLLGSALQDLAFDIPSFEGFGLQQASVRAAGSTGDRLGLYGAIGPVGYQSAGCGDGSGGCDAGAGCQDTGCSSGRVPVRVVFIGFALLLAGLRRRR
ncbi:MAG: hypothetical protein H6737_25035 [Alphaproteobacteria bacterium]|nr:hypothetical protein [Alphaproteobacteria bacterium]